MSDLITNSVPGEGGSHTITFTTANAVPASGKIIIDFQAGGITNLASLGIEDIDVASSSEYTVSAPPAPAGELEVQFSSSRITIVLDSNGIAAGTPMTVELGPVATFGISGDTSLLNGASLGSYKVTITTRTAGDAYIDTNQAIFVLVQPVGLHAGTPSPTPTSTPTPTPTPGGGGGGTPTPSPLFNALEFWPAEYATLTPEEFSEADFADVATLMSVTADGLYAALAAQYPALAGADAGDLAAALGLSGAGLQASLVSEYPQLVSLSAAQFSALSLEQLADLLDVGVGGLLASLGVDMSDIAELAGTSVASLYEALGIEDFRYMIVRPAPVNTLSFDQFTEESATTVAALLGLSIEEFYAVLAGQYPPLATSLMSEVASELGYSTQELYDVLLAQFPQLSLLTPAQFGAQTAQQLATELGISIGELYAALDLGIDNIGDVADVPLNDIYDDLGIEGMRFKSEPPVLFPETAIGATLTPSDGEVQLAVGGEPYTYVTDTAATIGLSSIEGGDWIFTTYAQATDTGGQTSLTAQVWVMDATGQMTLLFDQLITNDLAPTLTEYQTVSPQPQYDFQPGDRIVLIFVTQTSGGSGAPVTVELTIGGTDRYSFVQSPAATLEIPLPCFRIADFVDGPREGGHTCRVNIYDLSVMMYNWPVIRNRPDTDLNTDGVVGIIDFSILLYWWTGY